ncbi:FMN-binding protein [Clostridium sp. B9]|uniref:FMN-binding protein n=1 Tax=Clostridium sp. B9 TaxID=3423224 RepID=UPI003D2ED9FA
MKKKFFVIALSLFALSNLVACGSTSTSEFKDGSYSVETKNADDHGYKAKLSIKVEDGKITEANYNEFSAETNELKRNDEGYNTKMTEVSGIGPADFEPQLEEALVKAQSAEIDVVTGATGSSEQFKTLAEKVLENAKEGVTEAALVD